MDFFAEQARVRSSTRVLVLLFIAAVVATVVAMDLLVWFAFGHWRIGGALTRHSLAITTIAVLALILGCAWYRIVSLSEGGKAVAAELERSRANG